MPNAGCASFVGATKKLPEVGITEDTYTLGIILASVIDNSANQGQNDARANVINNGGQGTKNSRANNTTDARGNTADQADFFCGGLLVFHEWAPPILYCDAAARSVVCIRRSNKTISLHGAALEADPQELARVIAELLLAIHGNSLHSPVDVLTDISRKVHGFNYTSQTALSI